jgi:hypothetical protein
MKFYNEETDRKFNSDLQQQIDGTLPLKHTYQLGEASEILQSAGIPKLMIILEAGTLRRKSKQDNHLFDLKDVKNLPSAVQNPLAVFDSRTVKGNYVIITEITRSDKNFIVALEANRANRSISVNSIRSIYPRDDKQMLKDIISGCILYADKNKMANLLANPRFHYEGGSEVSQARDIVSNLI